LYVVDGNCGRQKVLLTGLGFKRVELHTVKRRVMETLPKTKELNSVAIAHPVLYGETRVIAVAIAGDIGQRAQIIK